MFLNARIAVVVCGLLLSAKSGAEIQLFNLSEAPQARVLPSGQQTWSFRTGYQNISSRFANSGRIQPLGARYDRASTWGELIASEKSASTRQSMQSYMQQNGLNEDDVAATSVYKVQRQEATMQMNWNYGMTERWTIGLEIPMVWSQTTVTNDVRITPNLRGFAKNSKVSTSSMKDVVTHAAQEHMANSGYDAIPDQEQTFEWGDLNLVNQYALIQGLDWAWSMRQNVRFPASQNQSAFEYIQLSRDQGQIDVGLSSLVEYRWRRTVTNMQAGYIMQMADSVKMTVPGENNTTQLDNKVKRDLGDWYFAGVESEMHWTRRWSILGGYTFMHKDKDVYEGSADAKIDYNQLAEDSEQEMHVSHVGMNWIFDGSRARQGIENKWIAALKYSLPLAGRNSIDTGMSSLELKAYF